jgi:hypothetical protein
LLFADSSLGLLFCRELAGAMQDRLRLCSAIRSAVKENTEKRGVAIMVSVGGRRQVRRRQRRTGVYLRNETDPGGLSS